MNHRSVIPFDGREQSSFRGAPGGWAPPRAAIGRLDSNAAIDAPLEPFSDVVTREGVNEGFPGSIGSSAALMEVFDQVRIVAPADSTVLLEGETGTGKELVARAVHAHSNRRQHAFIKLNCAAIPAGLLESEIFGHERGAFTGAVTRRLGRFEAADRGTLFLDEIGETPLELQAKLLRVLQEREFERVGSTQTHRADVRIVAATNQSLAALVSEKRFRSDLYYRLNVFPISIPPLRRRRQDIPLLAVYFVAQFARRMHRHAPRISPDAMEALLRYPWPGNIRELQNVLERAVLMTTGEALRMPTLAAAQPEPVTLEDVERTHIRRTLDATNWVVSGPAGAASLLGMKRSTLVSKIQRMGIRKGGDLR